MRTTSSSVPMPSTGAGPSVPGRAWIGSGGLEGEREQAADPGRRLAAAVIPGPFDVGRPRDEAARPALPDPDSAAPVASRIRRHASSRAGSSPAGSEATSARSARRSSPADDSVSVWAAGVGSRRPAARGAGLDSGTRRGARLRRREEPLEVAQPVAAVAAVVDPVVAEPAGLAPRPDRVRMHAKDTRRLRDRQRRVARTRGPGDRWRHGGFGRHCRSGRMLPDFTTVANRTMFS